MSDYTDISISMILIHKSHVFELRTETKPEMSDCPIFNATYVVTSERHEKFTPERDLNPNLYDAGAMLNWANWELVIMCVSISSLHVDDGYRSIQSYDVDT